MRVSVSNFTPHTMSTPTSPKATIEGGVGPESNLRLVVWMWMDVDMQERVPRRIDGEAAVSGLLNVDIRSPAHDYLAGVENSTVEHTADSADATLVGMADQREELGVIHGTLTFDTS